MEGLDIQEADVLGVFLDEHAARLDLVAHQHREQPVSRRCVFHIDADELRETTMDPATRTLVKVTMEDAASADLVFSMLMGDQVEPRREFIEANARSVINLDV